MTELCPCCGYVLNDYGELVEQEVERIRSWASETRTTIFSKDRLRLEDAARYLNLSVGRLRNMMTPTAKRQFPGVRVSERVYVEIKPLALFVVGSNET